MRGSPLLRALAAFFVIAALGWPLQRLTHRSEARPAIAAPAEVEERLVSFAFSFTAPPTRVAIWHLGQEKWSTAVKEAAIETQLELPWPKEGVDVRVVIDWPEGNPLAAAQLRVTDPEGTEHVASIFSEGPADEVLTFH